MANWVYGVDYCLSAESSLLLHAGSTTIPSQVIVITKEKGQSQTFPFSTSLYAYPDRDKVPDEPAVVNGVQCMPLALALCKVSPGFFLSSPLEVEIALSMVSEPAEFLDVAMTYGLPRGLGRVIAAYSASGKEQFADQIRSNLKRLGLSWREENPFAEGTEISLGARARSPYAKRIEALWHTHRDSVLQHLPELPGLWGSPEAYLTAVDEIYTYDAYHSLSIEGYHVTSELVDRVRNDGWDPEHHPEDARDKDALVARGYYEAFQQVKETLAGVLQGKSASELVEKDLPEWYGSLWAPALEARIIDMRNASGYRRGPVYIRGSIHVPPPREALLDSMDALFNCLRAEEHPGVRAVLGHYIFVFIHPFPDGNGRIARFLMNTMLASGGYPWTVIRVSQRRTYVEALEHVHTNQDIAPFARFVAQEMVAMKDVSGGARRGRGGHL